MSEENKNGDMQTDTAANNAEEKKPITSNNLEDELKKAQEELQGVRDRLADKEKQSNQLTEEIGKLRIQMRHPLITNNNPAPKVIENQDGFDDGTIDDFDTKYQVKRESEKKQEYIEKVNRSFDRFIKDHDKDWNSEIDLEFRRKANQMNLGMTEDEIKDNFNFIFKGLSTSHNTQSEDERKNKIVDVGDGGFENTNRTPSGKIDWKTKKLNKFQVEAAKWFTGGEKAYREKMQEISDAKE